MKLHSIVADRLLSQSAVTDSVARNEDDFTDLVDQYCVRIGGLYEHDPYPGIVIEAPNQKIHSDLQDVACMMTAGVTIRVLDFDLAKAYELANACAFNGQEPADRPASGLDGWRDISKGIQSFGLRSISEVPVAPADSNDRLFWIVEYHFSTDWNMTT